MDTTPCSCGGANPRCFRCDGTGLFNSDRQADSFAGGIYKAPARPGRTRGKRGNAAVPGSAAARPTPSPVNQTREYTVCSLCFKPILKGGGCGHECGKIFTSLLANIGSSRRRPSTQCPQCGVWVRRLERHTAKVHQVEPVIAGETPARMLHKCRYCKAMVKDVEKHNQRARRNEREVARNAASGSSPIKTAKRIARGSTSRRQNVVDLNRESAAHETPPHGHSGQGVAADESRRDATYGWGGSFRDHGQFGSHPSYDSMDDESSA